jgi:uncharacterized integral membrane protein
MNSQVSEGVSLLYLQLLQDAAVRAMNAAGRLFLVRVVLTIVLLVLAIGVVRTEEQFGLSGLNFELDLWVLLVAVAVLGLVLLVFDVAHCERGHRLAWRVVRLYEDLGFDAPRAEWNSPDSPFGLPYAAAFPLDALESVVYISASCCHRHDFGDLWAISSAGSRFEKARPRLWMDTSCLRVRRGCR